MSNGDGPSPMRWLVRLIIYALLILLAVWALSKMDDRVFTDPGPDRSSLPAGPPSSIDP